MTPKERVLAVLDRQAVDRLPVDLWYTPEVLASLQEHFGLQEEPAIWNALGLDKIVWVNVPCTAPWVGQREGEYTRGQWGALTRGINTGTAEYAETAEYPLRNAETIADIDACPYFPDPDQFDYDAAVAFVERYSDQYAILGPWVSFFEIFCGMRGLDTALMDLYINPEFSHHLLDRIEEAQTGMLRRFYDRCADRIDLMFLSDDMGSQSNLLISLDTWDTYFKDRMKRWCDLAHEYDIKVFYHTDGAAFDLVSRLVDAGIDVLNPIQHACPGMDRAKLKEEFGDRIVFHGGVENQQVLPFGSADDVRHEVRTCMDTLGAGNEGYIVCSCHNAQAGTPVENILAMVETVKSRTAG